MDLPTKLLLSALACMALFTSCSQEPASSQKTGSAGDPAVPATQSLFVRQDAAATGIDFINGLTESAQQNYFNYMYFYNGGGVAVGDINADGLADIYLTGNMVPNRLYLNRGNLKFEDITAKAGVAGDKWCTGVTMADVNGDGLLDIYVCRGGPYYEDIMARTNLLYINNGNLTFSEQAAKWQCNDAAFGTHASFFDYDRDGDLDLYVVNHPYQFGSKIDFRLDRWLAPQDFESDRFFRNDGIYFTDVTDEIGIKRFAFGLSATVTDLNQDGWMDVYVANDFSEPDLVFMNRLGIAFEDRARDAMPHQSNFSMGSDAADFNNDGWPDLAVLDMMAEDNRRKKTNMSGMNPEAFWRNVGYGRHFQYMQNALQLNHGVPPGTSVPWLTDVAQMAGVSTTDWSWAPLFADFDNDGWQDLYVTNGYRRDARDNDYMNQVKKQGQEAIMNDYQRGLALMPEEKISNYMFRNRGDLRFDKVTADWGLDQPSWSNGAAYADLDNDGDLDLVVNNLEETAAVYENRQQQVAATTWLRVRLNDTSSQNRLGYGATVRLFKGDQLWQTRELIPSRGYQSSVEPVLHFGLGQTETIDLLEVQWADGNCQQLRNVPANQLLTIDKASTFQNSAWSKGAGQQVVEAAPVPDFRHAEETFDDFEKEILLPHRQSQLGPALATADAVDGQPALFYVGGAAGQAGAMFREVNGAWKPLAGPWLKQGAREEVAATFFDANGDGRMDLYVVSGSNEFPKGDELYSDRLYLQTAAGDWKPGPDLPVAPVSGGCVAAGDLDGDGQDELFVGGRAVPGAYPFPERSYLLRLESGEWKDITASVAADLQQPGMVTDALWQDWDGDGDQDLLLCGEWMPLSLYLNEGGKLKAAPAGLAGTEGWWNRLEVADVDGDGDLDFVAGNMGLNTKYPVSEEEPLHIYVHDFDENGSLDIVLGYYNEGECYPVRGRTCTSQQMPGIKQQYPTYEEFGKATIADIYGQNLKEALHREAKLFASVVGINDGKGNFTIRELPRAAQLSAVNGIVSTDLNGDQIPDLFLAGNMYETEVETSRADASVGNFLLGSVDGGYRPVSARQSHFWALGDIKNLRAVQTSKGLQMIAAINDGKLRAWFPGQIPL